MKKMILIMIILIVLLCGISSLFLTNEIGAVLAFLFLIPGIPIVLYCLCEV